MPPLSPKAKVVAAALAWAAARRFSSEGFLPSRMPPNSVALLKGFRQGDFGVWPETEQTLDTSKAKFHTPKLRSASGDLEKKAMRVRQLVALRSGLRVAYCDVSQRHGGIDAKRTRRVPPYQIINASAAIVCRGTWLDGLSTPKRLNPLLQHRFLDDLSPAETFREAPRSWAGAVEKTRTSTGVTPQAPQACASTIPPRPLASEART